MQRKKQVYGERGTEICMEECKYFSIHWVLHMGCDMTSLLHGMSAFKLMSYSHGHMRCCDTVLAMVELSGTFAWVRVGLWQRVDVYCLTGRGWLYITVAL